MELRLKTAYITNTFEQIKGLVKTEQNNFFDMETNYMFNNEGIKLTYLPGIDIPVSDEDIFIIHKDYLSKYSVEDLKVINSLEDIDENVNENTEFLCGCKKCSDYRDSIEKDGYNVVLENIIIYHEFLLENDKIYRSIAYKDLFTSNPYALAYNEVLGLFTTIYKTYINFIETNNFTILLPEHIENWLSNINEKSSDIKKINESMFNEANRNEIIPQIYKGNTNIIGKSMSELKNYDFGIFENVSKYREFDSEYWYDVNDKIYLIKVLKKKIKQELNIKIFIETKNNIRLNKIKNLTVLEKVYEALVNLYEQTKERLPERKNIKITAYTFKKND